MHDLHEKADFSATLHIFGPYLEEIVKRCGIHPETGQIDDVDQMCLSTTVPSLFTSSFN